MTELDSLLQRERRQWFEQRVGSELWTTVFSIEHSKLEYVTIYAALIPSVRAQKALEYESWDLSIGDGMPCCAKTASSVRYLRFGTDIAEPLVFSRGFHALKPEYLEIAEEFRHFHNLYQQPSTGEFIKIHRDGTAEVIAKITEDRVEMKTIPLRQFLAIKEMHAGVFIDSRTFSSLTIDQVPEDERTVAIHNGTTRYVCSVREWKYQDRGNTFSRFVGKKLVGPLPKEKSGFWPYNEDEQKDYEEFTIGADEAGQPVRHTSNPEKLANYFGKNRGAPHYLTPVFFRRDVLTKYYQQPQKYRVSDGYLACGSLWGVQIDNDHKDYVIVYLGDLGRDLPHDEQIYWRSYNIPPQGTISETNFRRSFLAEFADATSTDHTFKAMFTRFQRDWREKLGWDLFLPLNEGDTHHITAMRTPVTNDQAEFDGLVLSLTKILIDSINEDALLKNGAEDVTGSIAKLEDYLGKSALPDIATHIKFLRNVQTLRSTGVGHRKGSKYEKAAAAVGIGSKELRDVFDDLLRSASAMLASLRAHFLTSASTASVTNEAST
jgi:hypothetical protein